MVPTLAFELFSVVTHELDHGLQVFKIQEQQTVVVGYLEGHGQDAALGFVQI
jgi:hypothetical protein